MNYKKFVLELFAKADIDFGSDINSDIVVQDERTYKAIVLHGSLGLAESYMLNWWHTDNLSALFKKIIQANLRNHVSSLRNMAFYVLVNLVNLQKKSKSAIVAEKHYNIGNDLYQSMLGKSMIYTCAYWEKATDLTQAQYDKLNLVAKKLHLKKTMRVLDIGSGWGSSAKFIADNYGVHVTAICNSTEQYQYAKNNAGDSNVKYLLGDYRDLTGQFDGIYSLGMFEHVGFKNYDTYFKQASQLLTDDGLFLLHTIGHKKTSTNVDPFMNKYIFPGGILPSIELIGKRSSKYFTMEDWHNFGADYAKTLAHWNNNFQTTWQSLQKKGYEIQFKRMWEYYLNLAGASFAVRHNHLWQIVFSKGQQSSRYTSVR